MSKNLIMQNGRQFAVACTSPTTPASGDPVRYGNLTGVALNNEGEGGVAASTETVVDFGQAIWDLSVTDTGAGGISAGDVIFFHDADPPLLNTVSASGYFFGFALEAIAAGLTDTINVLHVSSPAAGALGAGTVGTTNVANDAITNDKLDNITRGYVKVGGASNAPTDLNAKTSGQILVGDGTDVVSVAVSGDAALSSAGVVSVKKFGVSPKGTVAANNASATLTAADFGKIQTNTGAGAGIALTLPAAATASGLSMKIAITAAQIVDITPASGEKVYLNGSGVASKYCSIPGVVGNFADIYCDGTDYMVVNYSGALTKQA